MQITLQLRSDIAQGLADRSPPAHDTSELLQTLSRFGVSLQPLHPNTNDPELLTQFWITVPDQATADEVLQQLHSLKAVQAAYRKPPDEMP